jgi:hypothetical protein
MQTTTCRHGVDYARVRRGLCELCWAHRAGFDTATHSGKPDADQLSALANTSSAHRAAWWCGFAEGNEPIETNALGHRVSSHRHTVEEVRA